MQAASLLNRTQVEQPISLADEQNKNGKLKYKKGGAYASPFFDMNTAMDTIDMFTFENKPFTTCDL